MHRFIDWLLDSDVFCTYNAFSVRTFETSSFGATKIEGSASGALGGHPEQPHSARDSTIGGRICPAVSAAKRLLQHLCVDYHGKAAPAIKDALGRFFDNVPLHFVVYILEYIFPQIQNGLLAPTDTKEGEVEHRDLRTSPGISSTREVGLRLDIERRGAVGFIGVSTMNT